METPSYDLTAAVEALSGATELEQVTGIVARAARELMGADGATFVLRSDDKCFYVDEDAIGPLWKGSKFPLTACISGWAMLNRETAVIPDIYVDDRIPHDAYRPTFVKSLAMAPVRREDPLAAIGAYWATEYTPSPQEVRLLEVLANSASVALLNLELRGAVGRRQAERDEFESAIHTLVHDLRSPLGAIRGYAELIEDGGLEERDVQSFAATIGRASERLEEQISRMLALYRVTHAELHPAKVDLTAMSEEIAGQIAQRHEHAVKFSAEPGLLAEVDPVLARLMLQNLIDNAYKYSRDTAGAKVWLERVDLATPFTTFRLRDNGAGFAADQAGLLFEPMVRLHTQSEFEGTGLGLASVARIVDLHGGAIRAESEKGAGAAFYFSFPAPATVAMPTASLTV